MISEINKSNKIRTISLFSGAGGLDIGAIFSGANIVWANDMMKDACFTYKKNIGEHIIQGDINSHLDNLSNISNIDLIIGGPPCQGFSVAGKMDENDKRSQLIWSFAKAVSIIKPKAFIMENVKSLGSLNKWVSIREKLLLTLRQLGYSVNFIILNATEFNVPQSRERIFIIGFNGDSKLIPDLEKMISIYKEKAPSVRESLLSLDKAGTGNNLGVCKAKITLAKTPIMRKSAYAGMLFNGLGRPVKIDGYSSTLPASMGGNKTPIIDEEELYNRAKPWIEYYHGELQKDLSIAKDKKAPSFLRRMTVEEAALLQTFPLGYEFLGSQSSKYTQIGNAVPCNLAKAVSKMVIDILNKKTQIIYKDVDLKLFY